MRPGTRIDSASVDASTWVSNTNRSSAWVTTVGSGSEASTASIVALLGVEPLRALHPEVVHAGGLERGVVALVAPGRRAAECRVQARCRCRSPTRWPPPATTCVAGREATNARGRGASWHTYHRRSATSAAPPAGGPSQTTRPLLSSITRSAMREISRLWVTTITVWPARACCCRTSSTCTPVW